MKLLFIFLLNIFIYSSDVFVRTVDMNEFSKSLRISQKLKDESQLIKTVQEEHFYNGTLDIPCHSSALSDLEMFVQSDPQLLYLPAKEKSRYELYKLAHHLQISQDRMRAIQRELCYSIDEFRELPEDIKAMVQYDIERDSDIQYHLVKSAIPRALPYLLFDREFCISDKKFVGRFVDTYKQEVEEREVKSLFVTRRKKEVKKILEKRLLELYSLEKLFQKPTTSKITSDQMGFALSAQIPLSNAHSNSGNVFIKSFGKFLFVCECSEPSSISVYQNYIKEGIIPTADSIRRIAFNKNSGKKIAWALLYTGTLLQISKKSWSHTPQTDVVLSREIGHLALYDLLFDKKSNCFRSVFFSPSVDNGQSVTHISWKDDFDRAIQQRIRLTSSLPLNNLGLCYGNRIYFCSCSNSLFESGFLGDKSHKVKHEHEGCKKSVHFTKFCLTPNGLIHYIFFGHSTESQCAIGHYVNGNASYKILDNESEIREFLGNRYLLRNIDQQIILTSLKPIVSVYKELLPEFKKKLLIQDPQNDNTVVIQ